MTSIRPDIAKTPEENGTIETEPTRPHRRTVRLTVLAEPRTEADPLPPAPRVVRSRPRRVPVTRDDWLRLAERAVGDWASTLREALLMVVLFAGFLAAIGIAFGVTSAVFGAIAGLVVYLLGRRRGGSGHR